jgi:peptide/nickel transport system permease protein
MIWYGGRVSLFIGFVSTVLSTLIALIFGSLSGIAPQWLDTLMMRLTEILLSIPSLFLIILLQAIMGDANMVSISIVIGITSWESIAKVVRTEVRQIRNSDHVYGSNEYPKCNCSGIYIELHGHRSAVGSRLLGQYAVSWNPFYLC